jgi:hypothetical protein
VKYVLVLSANKGIESMKYLFVFTSDKESVQYLLMLRVCA